MAIVIVAVIAITVIAIVKVIVIVIVILAAESLHHRWRQRQLVTSLRAERRPVEFSDLGFELPWLMLVPLVQVLARRLDPS